jgi:hypothetical protein
LRGDRPRRRGQVSSAVEGWFVGSARMVVVIAVSVARLVSSPRNLFAREWRRLNGERGRGRGFRNEISMAPVGSRLVLRRSSERDTPPVGRERSLEIIGSIRIATGGR